MLKLTHTHLKQRAQSIVNYDRKNGKIDFQESLESKAFKQFYVPMSHYLRRDTTNL